MGNNRSLLAVILMIGGMLPACAPATFVVGLAPGGQQVMPTVVQRDGRMGSRRIAVIEVTGLIANAERGGLLSAGYNPVATLTEMLGAAGADERVAAVVLRLNTPGGTVTASDMMYREVVRFRALTGKPVVVSMMDLATSGGYYLACAADEVVAYPTTVTGSVGVVMQSFSVAGAMRKLGIESNALVSGPHKTAGSPFESLESEQRAILQGLVDGFYQRFVAVVRQARPGVAESDWAAVTDGRVFTGEQALALGLVDRLGDLREAITAAKRRAGVMHADVVVYHRPLEHVASAYASGPLDPAAARTTTQLNLLQLNVDAAGLVGGHPGMGGLQGARAGFYYVWRPGLE